jgi:adenylylsulfate kinase
MVSRGLVLWLTGLSGAGKTTIAKQLEIELQSRQIPVEVLDGDVVRAWLSQGLGFSRQDRDINVKRVGFVANLLSRHGVFVIVAMISPYRETRAVVRQATENFLEVYIDTPLEVCETRDVKGLYAKARAGEIKGFTGIDDPYEPPLSPEVVCLGGQETPVESATRVLQTLEQLGYLPGL